MLPTSSLMRQVNLSQDTVRSCSTIVRQGASHGQFTIPRHLCMYSRWHQHMPLFHDMHHVAQHLNTSNWSATCLFVNCVDVLPEDSLLTWQVQRGGKAPKKQLWDVAGHVSQRLPDLEELIGSQARHRDQVGLNLSSCNDWHSSGFVAPMLCACLSLP